MKLVDPANSVLLGKAEPVAFPAPSISRVAADMLGTMIQNQGCGLAAPQVGIPLRLFTYRVGNDLGIVINPLIMERGDAMVMSREGCLTLPGEFWVVERAKEILVRYQDMAGKCITRRLGVDEGDMLSIIFQHETDHLDGILISQHGHQEE